MKARHPPLQTCVVCGGAKFLTIYNVYPRASSKTGFENRCIVCAKKQKRKAYVAKSV